MTATLSDPVAVMFQSPYANLYFHAVTPQYVFLRQYGTFLGIATKKNKKA